MSINRGTDFEGIIRKQFENIPNCSMIRLKTTQARYKGSGNPCDFIAYKYPYEYLIETKSHDGKSFPFSAITTAQWEGLKENCFKKGVVAGFLIWFKDLDLTIFVTMGVVLKYYDLGYKSINPKKLKDNEYIILQGKKKRVFFEYDINKFFLDVEERMREEISYVK